MLIPVYNEGATLVEILRRVEAVPVDKEVIVVDNCSTDGTREELREMLQSGRAAPADGAGRLRVVLQTQNRGKGASVRRALALARGEFVIVQDADLEYDPNDYLKLLAVAESRHGRHAVFGTRLLPGSAARREQPHTAFYYGRIALSVVFRVLYGTPLSDVATCYKLLRREIAARLDLRADGFDLDFEIAAKLNRHGVRIVEVPITYHPRTELEGKKIRVVRDGLRAAYTLCKYRLVR